MCTAEKAFQIWPHSHAAWLWQPTQYLNEWWKGSASPCPAITHHPHTPVFAVALSHLTAGMRFTRLALTSWGRCWASASWACGVLHFSESRCFQWEPWRSPASSPFLYHLPCASSSSTQGLTWWEKTLGRSIPEERKCCQPNPQQLHPPALNPLSLCLNTRGHSRCKNMATALPKGEARKQMSDGISMALFLLQTLQVCSGSPGICLPWPSSPTSHLFSSFGLHNSTWQWNTYVIMHLRKMDFPSFSLNLLLNEYTR